MHQHVEGFRYTRPRDIVTLDNGLIGLGTTDDIVGFQGQKFLKNVRSTIRLECPYFHFTKTLATELRLTTQRLLRDQAIRSNRTRVHLIVDHVVQLDDIDDTYRGFLVKPFAGFAIIKMRVTKARQT